MSWILSQPTSVLTALKMRYPDSSGNTLRDWLKSGCIYVDGHVVRIGTTLLQPGQKIEHKPAGRPCDKSLGRYGRIVYEDRYLVVVDKAAGVLSVATDFDSGHTVHTALKQRYRPHPVFVIHRLDRGTSGLVVFARERTSFLSLKEQLAARKMSRRYVAVVKGIPTPPQGRWHSYLYEDRHYHMHSSGDPAAGEEAITHYRLLGGTGPYSLLEVTLETGKKNQIRVHCADVGLPIVGDDKYGGEGAARLYLHAYGLSFHHPKSNELMSFSSPTPSAFSRLIGLCT